MAKPNYSFEKRQRELAKKKKKEEKLAEKAARKTPGSTQGGDAGGEPADSVLPEAGAPATDTTSAT